MCGLCGFIGKSLKASGQEKFNSTRIRLTAGLVFEVIGYIQNLGQTESTNIETETRWKKKVHFVICRKGKANFSCFGYIFWLYIFMSRVFAYGHHFQFTTCRYLSLQTLYNT